MVTKFSHQLPFLKKLVRINTINPPGNEALCAQLIQDFLGKKFFLRKFFFASERINLIVIKDGKEKFLYLCGHMDTVPLGKQKWSVDPFSGEIKEGKLYGRGASDMKSGLAAMIFAAQRLPSIKRLKRGLVLLFTCAEETFCEGARALVRIRDQLPPMGAMVVCEPTSNQVCVGHKGAIHYRVTFQGKSAHASMPHLGINAIYKACTGVQRIQALELDTPRHPLLGHATLNVGTIDGGENINSVPDVASIGLDIRVLPGQTESEIRANLEELLGPDVKIELLNQAPGIYTSPDDPWVSQVMEVAGEITGETPQPSAVPYFTDASVLTPAFGNPPTVILGPGEPEMAHKTDEYCYISKLEEATEIYWKIIEKWCLG